MTQRKWCRAGRGRLPEPLLVGESIVQTKEDRAVDSGRTTQRVVWSATGSRGGVPDIDVIPVVGQRNVDFRERIGEERQTDDRITGSSHPVDVRDNRIDVRPLGGRSEHEESADGVRPDCQCHRDVPQRPR